MKSLNEEKYKNLALKIRVHCLHMTHGGKSGHVGSMLSMADLLAVLYEKILRVDPKRPDWPERDRFVLSKGHGGGAVYAVLAEGCKSKVKFKRLALPDINVSKVGSQQWLLAQYGLDPQGISKSVRRLIET